MTKPTLPPNDPRHGTANGYNNLGCRCQPCRKAWADTYRERSHRLGWHAPQQEYLAVVHDQAANNHGTEGTHKRCKCATCRRAATTARNQRRWLNIEATRAYDRAYKAKQRAQQTT